MTVPLVKLQNGVGSRTAGINEIGMAVGGGKKKDEYFL